MVWKTREVRGEMNHSRFTSLHLLPLLPTNVSGHAPPTYAPHKTCRSPTTPMPTPTSTLTLVPATQPLTSVHVNASTDTRSRGSSADMFCNEVVGVPHYRLP